MIDEYPRLFGFRKAHIEEREHYAAEFSIRVFGLQSYSCVITWSLNLRTENLESDDY